MMKKIITVIAAAFMAISASAQSEVGSLSWQPNMGITYTTATSDLGEWADGAVALTAGVEAMYMLKDKLGIALGVNYTAYDMKVKDLHMTRSNEYFNVPVTADYYVVPGLAIKAGVALNLLFEANMNPLDGNPYYYSYSNSSIIYEIALEPKDDKDYYKSTFFSVPVGASYEYKHFVFDARYNIGLSKVADVCKGTYNVFTFTLGYKF